MKYRYRIARYIICEQDVKYEFNQCIWDIPYHIIDYYFYQYLETYKNTPISIFLDMVNNMVYIGALSFKEIVIDLNVDKDFKRYLIMGLTQIKHLHPNLCVEELDDYEPIKHPVSCKFLEKFEIITTFNGIYKYNDESTDVKIYTYDHFRVFSVYKHENIMDYLLSKLESVN